MKRIIVKCGCSHVIETIETDNRLTGLTIIEAEAECETCQQNGGRYDRSPHWKEIKPAEIYGLQLQKLGARFPCSGSVKAESAKDKRGTSSRSRQ